MLVPSLSSTSLKEGCGLLPTVSKLQGLQSNDVIVGRKVTRNCWNKEEFLLAKVAKEIRYLLSTGRDSPWYLLEGHSLPLKLANRSNARWHLSSPPQKSSASEDLLISSKHDSSGHLIGVRPVMWGALRLHQWWSIFGSSTSRDIRCGYHPWWGYKWLPVILKAKAINTQLRVWWKRGMYTHQDDPTGVERCSKLREYEMETRRLKASCCYEWEIVEPLACLTLKRSFCKVKGEETTLSPSLVGQLISHDIYSATNETWPPALVRNSTHAWTCFISKKRDRHTMSSCLLIYATIVQGAVHWWNLCDPSDIPRRYGELEGWRSSQRH